MRECKRSYALHSVYTSKLIRWPQIRERNLCEFQSRAGPPFHNEESGPSISRHDHVYGRGSLSRHPKRIGKFNLYGRGETCQG